MPDQYILDKTIEALKESVRANQSSATANTRNAEATEKVARLVEADQIVTQNLVKANEALNETMKEVVKGLESVAAGQKILAEGAIRDKDRYFKYLVYAVIFIIIILGGSAALKVFFGVDFASLLK